MLTRNEMRRVVSTIEGNTRMIDSYIERARKDPDNGPMFVTLIRQANEAIKRAVAELSNS